MAQCTARKSKTPCRAKLKDLRTTKKKSNMEIEASVDVELDMFDMDDIIEYLEDSGYTVTEDKAPAPVKIAMPKDDSDIRETLINILQVGHWVSNEYIIELIKNKLSL